METEATAETGVRFRVELNTSHRGIIHTEATWAFNETKIILKVKKARKANTSTRGAKKHLAGRPMINSIKSAAWQSGSQ